MIAHVSVGVLKTADAKGFYEAVFAALNYRCLSDYGTAIGYGRNSAEFWIIEVPSPVVQNSDDGLHFCFVADERSQVDEFYRLALANGAEDNGKPGLRPNYGDNYYAAFVIDPSGYRLEAYCAKPA